MSCLREFRYDGARARYLNRKLDQYLSPVPGGTVWSDYDGDEVYGDFIITGSGQSATITETNSYELGVWQRFKNGTTFTSEYLHGDHLGTLRQTTGTTGAGTGSDVFTAFGERIAGSADRFGYVGAWGYQSTPIPESPNPDTAFPFLHVGARYYDPASGRFLQRDPIGIRGGGNVYTYTSNRPTIGIDPSGLVGINGEGDRPPPGYVEPPPFKTPGKIVEEVNDKGDRSGHSDKRRHFTVSCRVTRECYAGPFIIIPGATAKEIWDLVGGADWWDSATDMYFNLRGWWDGMANGGMSCAELWDHSLD